MNGLSQPQDVFSDGCLADIGSPDTEAAKHPKAMQQPWAQVPGSVVKSAGRALQILEFFDDVQRPAHMTEISHGLGYPESSSSVLLRSLVTLGYLDYDRHKRTFRPTSRVRLLGSWVNTQLFKNDKVLRLMEQLNAEADDAIILASRNGLSAQYIHIVQARTALRLHLTPGTERPVVQSTTGWVMLSRLPDKEIAMLVRRANAEMDSLETLVRLPELMGRIEHIRREGYIMSDGVVTPGCAVVAMPLPTHLTEGSLVLAIGGPSSRIGEHRKEFLVELMRRRIREHLGDERGCLDLPPLRRQKNLVNLSVWSQPKKTAQLRI